MEKKEPSLLRLNLSALCFHRRDQVLVKSLQMPCSHAQFGVIGDGFSDHTVPDCGAGLHEQQTTRDQLL